MLPPPVGGGGVLPPPVGGGGVPPPPVAGPVPPVPEEVSPPVAGGVPPPVLTVVLPPLGLSSPPPPQETSRLASNRTLTRVMKRFINNPCVRNAGVSVGRRRVVPARRGMSRRTGECDPDDPVALREGPNQKTAGYALESRGSRRESMLPSPPNANCSHML